jgi:hypothetical protein
MARVRQAFLVASAGEDLFQRSPDAERAVTDGDLGRDSETSSSRQLGTSTNFP